MPFDYSTPAELFLAKRTKSSREKYRRFATAAEAIRYAAHPEPSALGCRLGMRGLTADASASKPGKRGPYLKSANNLEHVPPKLNRWGSMGSTGHSG